MSSYEKWAGKQRGKLVYLAIGVAGLIFTGYLSYSRLYPLYRRRKMRQAEEYANIVYEFEQKRQT